MKFSIISLPLWVSICHGAALPQTLGFPTGPISIPGSRPTSGPSLTFVIPCIGSGCTPRTITIFGRDSEQKAPRTVLAREPQVLLPGVSRTNIILPPAPTSDCDETTTKKTTSTKKPHPSTSSDCSTSSSKGGWWKRQVLGSPTRTNLITPTPSTPAWPVVTSTVVVTVTETETTWPSSSSWKSSSTTKKSSSWSSKWSSTSTKSPSSSWSQSTTAPWSSASPTSDCDSETVTSTSADGWSRSTSYGDGSTRTGPVLTVPTLHERNNLWETTTTVYMTATKSSSSEWSSSSSSSKWSSSSSSSKWSSSSSSSGWDYVTTTTVYVTPTSSKSSSKSTPKPKPTTSSNVFTNTFTLPPLTFTKRDVQEAQRTTKKKTTTTYPRQRTTLTAGSGRTISNTASIPRITFTAPLERDVTLESTPTATDTADLSRFTGWGWSWPSRQSGVPTLVLSPPRKVEREAEPEPQVLGSPTRTNLITPPAPTGWPWWPQPPKPTAHPTSVVTVTVTKTETVTKEHPHPTETTTWDNWGTVTTKPHSPTVIGTTVTLPPLTFTEKEKRQDIILTLTRTMITIPTLQPVITGLTTVVKKE